MTDATDPRLEYPRCFGCGSENPIGLALTDFRALDDGVRATFRPRPEFAGFDDTLHGGIVATALDEASAWAGWHQHGVLVFTAKLEIRYRRQARSDVAFDLAGRVVERRGKRLMIEAEMSDPDGAVASSAGLFLVATEHMVRSRPADGSQAGSDARPESPAQENSTTTDSPSVT
jgi:acyl-coenzyme A thioesterase PaaI-like protein